VKLIVDSDEVTLQSRADLIALLYYDQWKEIEPKEYLEGFYPMYVMTLREYWGFFKNSNVI
jgi:hypothetical protein